MYRARRWTVVLLVLVTALVAGFARLDGEGARAPRAVAPVGVLPEDDEEADAAQAQHYFRLFTELVDELAHTHLGAVPALPPVDQLPPLPSELLPSEADGAEG
jgi:hypothetical protein